MKNTINKETKNKVKKINFKDKKIAKKMETKLGMIEYTDDDIFYFHEGLAGFPHSVKFTLTELPGVAQSDRYGMMQSLEDASLSFIIYYPALNESQQESILKTVKDIAKDEQLTKEEIGFAFFVITQQNNSNIPFLEYAKDAPLVFVNKTKEAWQVIRSQ